MILSDNLRKFRRVLQGRGVNLREAMVTGLDGSGTDARVAIANLQDDDVIDSFMNMTDLTDASAGIAMERKASSTLFGTNKGAAKLVDADLVGTGVTVLTATGPHKLGAAVAGDVSASVVGYLREQGATTASLVTDLGLDPDDLERDLRYEAVTPGAVGGQGTTSPITIEYIAAAYPADEAETTVAVGPYNNIE